MAKKSTPKQAAHRRKFAAASKACKGLGKQARKSCMRSKLKK